MALYPRRVSSFAPDSSADSAVASSDSEKPGCGECGYQVEIKSFTSVSRNAREEGMISNGDGVGVVILQS